MELRGCDMELRGCDMELRGCDMELRGCDMELRGCDTDSFRSEKSNCLIVNTGVIFWVRRISERMLIKWGGVFRILRKAVLNCHHCTDFQRIYI